MNPLDKLIQHFESFPGVGARQAKRFAFHILTLNDSDTTELANLIAEMKGQVIECASCRRFFVTNRNETLCSICTAPNRDQLKILVVERDQDIQAIERAGVYNGLYFVLGGTVPLLNTAEKAKLRGAGLKATVEARLPTGLKEVILGFSINPDGENTARFVESLIGDLLTEHQAVLTHLGRGLSTGSELEYADPETIKSAFKNRS